MCEVWKWIIIATLAPLLIIRLWDAPWLAGDKKWLDWLVRIGGYQRYWWLGVAVLTFATVVYGAHCR